MQHRRFNRDIAKREFTCYDCRTEWERGSELVFDNKRDCKICIRCLKKLEAMLSEEKEAIAHEGKKPRWNPSAGIKPWLIGDYDINSWPEDLQLEYRDLERQKTEAMYASGFNLAFVDGVARAVQR
jgi:hypothetical protein